MCFVLSRVSSSSSRGRFLEDASCHESLGSATQILSTQSKAVLEELYYIHFCRSVERHVMVLCTYSSPLLEQFEDGVVPRDAADDDAA